MEMKFLYNKKGMDIAYREIIFILLNIVVFGSVMFFVFKASTGAIIYEQMYAKQIALSLDSSEPGMNITFGFKEGYEMAEKNNYDGEGDKLLVIDEENSYVRVMLSSRGGYKYKYFSDHSYKVFHDIDDKEITVSVSEKSADKEGSGELNENGGEV